MAARLASSSLIASLISSRLCFGANKASAISRCSVSDISVLRCNHDVRHTVIVGMHDNAFATKRFTRKPARQGVRQTLYQLSDSWKQKTRRNAAKRAGKAIKYLQVV